MAFHENSFFCTARLAANPEIRSTASGAKVVNVRLVIPNQKKDGEKWVDDPVFISATCFGRIAEAASSAATGREVFVSARLVQENWKDKSTGEARSRHALVVETFKLIEKFSKSDTTPAQEPSEAADFF